MIIKSTVKKFQKADDYAAFWRVPVPLVKSICICKAMRLHPYLETSGDPSTIAQHRRFVLQYFARHLRHLAFHRAIEDFDAKVNDSWQLEQSEFFELELMEEGA